MALFMLQLNFQRFNLLLLISLKRNYFSANTFKFICFAMTKPNTVQC